jgi:penicillin amidase
MGYLDGINIWKRGTPIEFQLVGVQKEKFTIKDVYNIFGYMSLVLLWRIKQIRY